MEVVLTVVAILLAAVIGFAVHRASLCNVKAIAELLSSLTRRSFVLDWRVRLDWLRNLFGGILMGVGVTMAPGGNDVLIFHAIPGGLPHAPPAYAALLVGTAAGLMVIRKMSGTGVMVECTGDVCHTRMIPRRSMIEDIRA